jgi:hypothetical protein
MFNPLALMAFGAFAVFVLGSLTGNWVLSVLLVGCFVAGLARPSE